MRWRRWASSLLYELPFNHEFSLMPAEAFVTEVLHQGIGARHLVCGPDFAFGHRRGGDTGFLAARAEALGMGVTLVPLVSDAQGPLSSTPHPPGAAGRLSGARDRGTGAALGDPRRGGAWRRARPDHRLSHRQHRAGAASGAGARGLRGDGAAAGRVACTRAWRISAAGRR